MLQSLIHVRVVSVANRHAPHRQIDACVLIAQQTEVYRSIATPRAVPGRTTILVLGVVSNGMDPIPMLGAEADHGSCGRGFYRQQSSLIYLAPQNFVSQNYGPVPNYGPQTFAHL